MFFSSLLSAEKAPSLDFKDFLPSAEKHLINPAGQAAQSGEILEHWFFSDALPEWIQYIMIFSASVAVLMIVAGGVMLMLNGAEEEMQTRGVKTITWAILGLIISVLSYTIVEIVNQIPITQGNPTTGTHITIDDEKGVLDKLASGDLRAEIIPDIIKMILKLVGVLALGLLLYAGVLMVLRDGDEENISKARKLVIWALVGIVVVVLAYAIVDAVVDLNFERNEK